jgi:hypothetical protein
MPAMYHARCPKAGGHAAETGGAGEPVYKFAHIGP